MAFKFLLIFVLLFSEVSQAKVLVKSILSSREISARLDDSEELKLKDRVLVYSSHEKKIIGIGQITEINQEKKEVKIEIEEIVDNYLIVKGDVVEKLDYNLYKEKNIPGFYSLTLNGGENVPAQFKELAYFGVFTSEGHTLDKHEVLISPFQIQYGITDDVGVRVVNALWLDGYANLGAKLKVLENKRAKITLNTLGAMKVQNQDWIGQAGGVVTLPFNSKFQSHFMVNVTFDSQYDKAHATKDLRLFSDSDIRSITEYITDDWNRILYGPVYNVEYRTFGGTVSYMWIWNRFHISLGLATRDLSNLTFGSKGYYYVYDLFWRF
jgi:hypothetical protein